MKVVNVSIFVCVLGISLIGLKTYLKPEVWQHQTPVAANIDPVHPAEMQEQERAPTAEKPDLALAVTYMDKRAENWMTTAVSARPDGNRCLSCHTVLSYSLARTAYPETTSSQLTRLRGLIKTRVEAFGRSGFTGPWYAGGNTNGSLSNEAIINALSLVSMDLAKGSTLTPLTEQSLEQLWQRQVKAPAPLAGGFEWLSGFGLEPLEATNSGYWGSALVGSTLSEVPGYANRRDAGVNLEALKKYLAKDFDTQNLHSKLMAIEANVKMGGSFIPKAKIDATLKQILGMKEANGGWSLYKLVNRKGAAASDNYATAMVVRAFIVAGQGKLPEVKKALELLRNSQQQSPMKLAASNQGSGDEMAGSFSGLSVNKNTQTLFMTDLATSMVAKTLAIAKKAGL